MKVGIIGSGEENMQYVGLLGNLKIREIYCFPGNAGTNTIAKNIEIDVENFEELKNFIKKEKIDLIIIEQNLW